MAKICTFCKQFQFWFCAGKMAEEVVCFFAIITFTNFVLTALDKAQDLLFFESLDFNDFTFTAIHYADKFTIKQQIAYLTRDNEFFQTLFWIKIWIPVYSYSIRKDTS